MGTEEDIAAAETAVGTHPTPAATHAVFTSGTHDVAATVIADRYEVLALLGVGGMGRVYRVHDRSLDETVALKLLRRELVDTPGVLHRFRQEVKLARRVTHPNVVRTFDLGLHGSDHFLTMELIDGRSLAQHIDDGLLPLDELFRIARAACAGIAAAHAAGVLHRDLKPDNILVAHSGRIAITDFGIAQDSGESRDAHAGTPAYMSPEQIEGRANIGPPADVYAFGAILFELVTGARPFVGKDVAAVLTARLTRPPPDPRTYCDMPDDLAELVLRCLAIDPARRLPDGAALAAALAEIDTARMAARAASVPQAVPAKTSRSVALLPLRASGDLGELADGLTEEIIDVLTNTRALRVRPLGSVRAAAATSTDAHAIGRTLGVDVVVDGSIRRRGDQVRVSARAIGVVDGFQLWASHVDVSPTSLLVAGDEIARAIARALTVEIELPTRRPSDPRATALYLEHKAKLRVAWDNGDVGLAMAGLEEARGLAPDDAAIVATLSMAYARAAFFGLGDVLDKAERLAQRAVDLAPANGEAHLALGLAHLYALRVPEATREFALAVHHAPGLARAQALLGAALLEADSLDDAVMHLEGAHALDPAGSQAADLPRAYFFQGRSPEEIVSVVSHLPRVHIGTRHVLPRLEMWRGHTVEPDAALHEVPDAVREYFEIANRVQTQRVLSDADLAALVRQIHVPNARLRTTRSQFVVEFLMFVGNVAKAMEFVQLAVESGLQDYCWMVRCPLLAPLRDRADYQALEHIVAGRARDVVEAVRTAVAS